MEMVTIFRTDVGDHAIEPHVADRLNVTKNGLPDRRFKTAKRDQRYFNKIKCHAMNRWVYGGSSESTV